jgi:hypothetical protein
VKSGMRIIVVEWRGLDWIGWTDAFGGHLSWNAEHDKMQPDQFVNVKVSDEWRCFAPGGRSTYQHR